MRKPLSLRVVERVEVHDPYSRFKMDCCGQFSFPPLHKCTTALRMLALGTATDAICEMVRMREITCTDTTARFSHVVVKVFEVEYLRDLTVQGAKWLIATGAARGFPGMLGSIDLE